MHSWIPGFTVETHWMSDFALFRETTSNEEMLHFVTSICYKLSLVLYHAEISGDLCFTHNHDNDHCC